MTSSDVATRLVRHHADPIGHLVGALSFARARFIDGTFVYVSDRGLAHLILTRRGYAAITFGHVIVCAREPTPTLLRHERHHVMQYEILGLAFLPLYLLLYRRHGYARHPLEREASGASTLFRAWPTSTTSRSSAADRVGTSRRSTQA